MIGKLTEEQCKDVIRNNSLGRLAFKGMNKIYVIPVNYAYDGKNIICHSLMGKKIEIMRTNPAVCFEIEEIKSLNNWKTILIWGKYKELTDERLRFTAIKLLIDKKLKMKVPEISPLPELYGNRLHPRSPDVLKPIIYQITIDEMSGRSEN